METPSTNLQPHENSFGGLSKNSETPTRCEEFTTRPNDDTVHWHIYVTLGFDVLNDKGFCEGRCSVLLQFWYIAFTFCRIQQACLYNKFCLDRSQRPGQWTNTKAICRIHLSKTSILLSRYVYLKILTNCKHRHRPPRHALLLIQIALPWISSFVSSMAKILHAANHAQLFSLGIKK